MDMAQVVETAKHHLLQVLGDELIEQPSTEEVWLDRKKAEWCVTLGIIRRTSPVAGLKLTEYKTVRMTHADCELVSIRNREFSHA